MCTSTSSRPVHLVHLDLNHEFEEERQGHCTVCTSSVPRYKWSFLACTVRLVPSALVGPVAHIDVANGSNFRLADLVTIMNGFCGAFSLFSTARYLLSKDKDHLWAALSFPFGGLFFDFLDGKVARWRNSASLLGQELDSLADLVRFNLFVCFGYLLADAATSIDFLLCRTCCACVCSRLTNMVGHGHPHLLHLLWPRPPCSFQRDCRTCPKRCHGQVEIL